MARVLLILSIVLTLVAAGLGFVAKQKVDLLNKAIEDRTSELHQTKNTLKKTQEDLAATKKELETTKQQLEEKTTQYEAAKKELDDASKKLEEKTTELAAAKKELDDLNEKLSKIPQNPGEDIGQRLTKLQEDLAKAQTELNEQKAVNDTLNQRVKDKEDALTASERTVYAYKNNVVRNGLSGKVLAYNPGWNFVVLSIGDRSGLKPGANMVVQRGNTMIAKVKVTTVEPNTAIADVVPSSVRGALTVEPGDTVIFQGPR